jgi:hypothetical protein
MTMPVYRRQEKNMSLLEYECYSYAYDEDVQYFIKREGK